jgi:hypothetical protein
MEVAAQEEQLQQRMRLGDNVEIDLPTIDASLFQAIKKRWHIGKVRTGKAGVAIATSGPGVSNLTAGLATANSEGDPVVALGGSVATFEALKQIHQTMERFPFSSLSRSTVSQSEPSIR